ncbi:MAG: ABC-ATPase domain-containing protein, partial [Faecalibacterium sp.]|nr:ABC-ATPase domain-containing protein [Faecalibacterium sp.]
MKRLKYYLLQMENNTSTYKEIYAGEVEVAAHPPYTDRDPTYWYDNKFSVEIDPTHKLAQDKPTLTWHIPLEELGISSLTTASADYCLRAFKPYIDELNNDLYNRSRPDNENGKYYLCTPGGEITVRNTAYFEMQTSKYYKNGSENIISLLPYDELQPPKMCLCIKMQVQLPKRKLRKTIQMLCRDLPEAIDKFITQFDPFALEKALELAEKQTAIRKWLKESDYCAFIANGSILPRLKGTDLPMTDAVPFKSTPDDEIEVCGVRGMGIRKGVTVITGGGYSGK